VAGHLPQPAEQARSLGGLSNYREYFGSPALSISFGHSLTVAAASTAVAVGVAGAYAYALARTRVPAKPAFRLLAMLPLYAPSLAQGIALVYLFGTKGLVTTGLLGYGQKWLGRPVGFDIHLYGMNGIILGEVYYVFPQAFLILMVALALTDGRLYEASVALRASPVRTFLTVTVPSIKYGLVSAVFVCFTLAFTDFGVPKVVGGNYNVLATDIYKQVIGQQNFVMGATISILLLVPTIIAFGVDRLVQRRQMSVVSARIVPLQPRRNAWVDGGALAFCALLALAIIVPMATIGLASVIDVWPYRLGLSLRHFDFRAAGGGGYAAYWDSLQLSIYTAIAGTLLTFFSAYLVEKGRGARWLRSALYFLSVLPVALPGLVIGLAYIFFFNPRQWTIAGLSVPNPFNFLYATVGLLVVANIAHFYTVSFLTATTALKQLDAEFEGVSASMRVPFHRTLWKVTLPLCLPAILEIGVYYFVNAMVTVSAVIFLYPPQFKLASVAIVNMDDAGQTAAAAAMSVLLIVTSLGVRMLYGLFTRQLQKRTQAWRVS
jgi:iron(III) transport system permease protein